MTYRRFVSMGVCWAVIAWPATTLAWRGGPPPYRNGGIAANGTSCRLCHGSTIGGGSVQILGAPSNYVLNRIYDLSVRVADNSKAGAGFEVSAESPTGVFLGTMIVSDPVHTDHPFGETGFVAHTGAGVDNAVANWIAMGRSATYNFQWRAPATASGPVTFYAAGNAINNNFSNSGDIIYLTNVTAQPTACLAGDVNGSESVDGDDVGPFVRVLINGSIDAIELCAADLNTDGVVDMEDAKLLVNLLIGL